jgi:uncharacterized membrane protein YtjA (UPF0391 family)
MDVASMDLRCSIVATLVSTIDSLGSNMQDCLNFIQAFRKLNSQNMGLITCKISPSNITLNPDVGTNCVFSRAAMTKYSIAFLIIVLTSAMLGFSDLLSPGTGRIARIIFFVFIALFILSLMLSKKEEEGED